MNIRYVSFLLCCLLFGGWQPAFATSAPVASEPLPPVFLSEVNWAGSGASLADEWIEISNGSREVMDLGGWILDGAATGGQALQLDDEVLLEPSHSLLIANYDTGVAQTTLAVSPDLVTSALSLSNNDLHLRLLTPQGIVVDSVDFGEVSAGSRDPFASAERFRDGSWVTSSLPSSALSDSDQLGSPGTYVFSSSQLMPYEEVGATNDPIVDSQVAELCCGCTCSPSPNHLADGTDTQTISEVSSGDDSFSAEPEATVAPETIEYLDTVEEDSVQVIYGNPFLLTLSEFVSDPASGPEWVELYNADSKPVLLDGLFLEDAAGGRTALAGVIEADSYYLIESPKGKLNNGDDTIILLSNSAVIDSVRYGNDTLDAPTKGYSAGIMSGEWTILETPTPGEANIPNIVQEDDIPALLEDTASSADPVIAEDVNEGMGDGESDDIGNDTPENEPSPQGAPDDINAPVTIVSLISTDGNDTARTRAPTTNSSSRANKSNDTFVRITSTVTVPPGVAGKQLLYLEGYQVYFHRPVWPTLAAGDLVRVEGELSASNGERRIKIQDASAITLLGPGSPTIQSLASHHLSLEFTGMLFSFSGEITARDTRHLTLAQESGSLRLRLPKGMNGNSIPSDLISGSGVLRSTKDGYYLDILSPNDVRPTSSLHAQEEVAPDLAQRSMATSEKPEKRRSSIAGAGLFTGTLGVLGYFLRKSLMLS